jgi:hypothetical protein
MYVFAVWFTNFHYQDELIGLYSTEELAQARIDRFDELDKRPMRIEQEPIDD